MNFSFKLKNFASIALIAITAFNLSSCKDDDNEAVPKTLQDSKAIVKTSTIIATSNETVYFDLVKNVVADKEKSSINLSGKFFGSTLKQSNSDYKFGYFDLEDTSVDKLKLADLTATKFETTTSLDIDATSMGLEPTAPIWLVYAGRPSHAVTPLANRYIVLYKGTELSDKADEIIVFNADNITAAQGVGTYTLKVKHFTR